ERMGTPRLQETPWVLSSRRTEPARPVCLSFFLVQETPGSLLGTLEDLPDSWSRQPGIAQPLCPFCLSQVAPFLEPRMLPAKRTRPLPPPRQHLPAPVAERSSGPGS